jgi:hypothetical protein
MLLESSLRVAMCRNEKLTYEIPNPVGQIHSVGGCSFLGDVPVIDRVVVACVSTIHWLLLCATIVETNGVNLPDCRWVRA